MKRKLLSIILCLGVITAALFLLPTQASAATEGYYTYTVSGGLATITEVSTSISGDITIPSTLGFFSVASIDYGAFLGCSDLTSVTIPDSVIDISSYAFYDCDSLTSVTISDSVTYIGGSAFYDCDSLTDIWVSADNPSYCSDARGVLFNKDKTTLIMAPSGITGSYTIPDSVTCIDYWAFSGCSSLTSVTIPDSVTCIDYWAFSGCSSLTSVTIPDSVTDIGSSAFSDCDNLKFVVIPSSVYRIGSFAFESCDNLSTVVIGSGVSVDEYAFEGCKNLSTLVVGYYTSIGYNAFNDCENLTEVCYPGTQEQWDMMQIGSGNEQLAAADLLLSIDSGICGYDYDSGWMKETTWMLYSNGIMIISGSCGIDSSPRSNYPISSVFITGGVPYIGDSAFSWCSDLTTVAIPSSVTSIGNHAFNGCTNLVSVGIASGVTSIGDYAFRSCESLTNITLPDSVTTIGDYAFYSCESLTSITLPDSVTTVGSYAFFFCDSLSEVHVPDIAAWCNINFSGSNANPLMNGANLYLNGKLVGDLIIPDSVTSIGNYAFFNCTGLSSITIGDSVTSIGNFAFSNCTGLSSITIGDSVTSIGNYAFSNCTGLSSITIGDSVTSIGDYAFIYTGVSSITIGDSVTSIGESAFFGCEKLTFVTIPDSITSINNNAFDRCNSLADVYYTGTQEQWDAIQIGSGNYKLTSANLTVNYDPDNADSIIGSGSCGTNLTWELDISGTLTISGTGAMEDYDSWKNFAPWHDYCKAIQSVVIPEGVTHIGEHTFYGCSSLTGITIPNSVTTIGNDAFWGCTGLTSLSVPSSVISIGESAFNSCENLTSVTIGSGVTSIGDAAFAWCYSLTGIWVDENNPAYSNDNAGVLFNKDKTTLIRVPNVIQSYTIPDSVTVIANRSFNHCKNLTSIVIPDGVTSIGDQAFQHCENLTNVTIPDSVTFIDTYAFDSCDSLTSIIIPDSITTISYSAFGFCDNLTSVVIPDSVTNIADYAFSYCNRLTDVYYTGTQEQWKAITIGYVNDCLLSANLTVGYIPPHICVEYGEWGISKQPTFTSEGERYLVCSKCGETLTETLEMLVGKVAQWNIALQDDFEVKFCLQVSESIVSTAKVRLTTGSETVTYNISALEKTADGYYMLKSDVSAAQMNDFIVVMVMNGMEIGSNTIYTVRQYCDTILADDSHSQYHALVKEMLHYGAMAQMYFGYDADNLANIGITGTATAAVPETTKELSVTDELSSLDFYGASLVYRDRIAVRYYFTGNVTGLTFTANGNTYTPVAKDGMHYVEIADILPQDLDQQITLTVTNAQGSGLTVAYSPMNYIVRMTAKGDENTKNLLKALYNYHLAAKTLNT